MGVQLLPMRQSYKVIPIYTADVSGVCSALYELGGMVVMHDPSGCNSTYNTHDEIRWYEQDSLIFISGLKHIDAVMGNDDKFISDVVEAATLHAPKFIALAGSPIPYMNGTDFSAIAKVIERRIHIPTFAIPTNGMHDYIYGAGLAMEAMAKRFVKGDHPVGKDDLPDRQKNGIKGGESSDLSEIKKCYHKEAGLPVLSDIYESKKTKGIHGSLNLLGVTPLDFGPQSFVDVMKKSLEDRGWHVRSTWAMGDTLETIAGSGEADVNLVVSAVGLRTAKYLYRAFGIPYVIGTPVEPFTDMLSDTLKKAVMDRNISGVVSYLPGKTCEKTSEELTLIGEPVTSGSLAAAIRMKYGISTRVLCPLDVDPSLLGVNDLLVRGEEDIEEKLKGAKAILADPLYKSVCPKDAVFYDCYHIAFSGRIGLKHMLPMSTYLT